MGSNISSLVYNSDITISDGSFHLRLVKPIGLGSFGAVYLAKDISGHVLGSQYYAVKCFRRLSGDSESAREQQREIANHRELSAHPNVVTLHTTIEKGPFTYLVLDLVEGGDLLTPIRHRKAYANNDDVAVKRTLLQIVDALAACHEKGIAHRDLKPENILCSKDNQQVYLADFGMSIRTRRDTTFCGSPHYMSPEFLEMAFNHTQVPYDTKPCDVWALGITFCNIITGRNPWHFASRRTDEEFISYLREGPSWFLENFAVSPAAVDILGRMLVLDPAARVTVPELRAAIVAVDTFYPEYAAPNPYALGPIPTTSRFCIDFMADAFAAASASSMSDTSGTGSDSAAGPPSLTASHHSSDTGESSDGPSTPETHPAGDVVGVASVSEIALNDDSDASTAAASEFQRNKVHSRGKSDRVLARALGRFVRARGIRS